MASGSFGNGSGQNCRLGINWSSSKGNSGSTVNATLIAQNQNNWYFSAYVYGGYGITINGNQKTGSGAQLSGSVNGSVGLISHSVWVAYTGDKTITISGYANFNGIVNLSNQTISGNVKLDNVGTAPSMGSVTAPSTGVISETSNSITVSWNGGSSYNGSGNYRVEVSINGGGWTSIATGLDWSARSYTYHLPNTGQGTSYQFRVDCSNNIGWSSYQYSGTVTLNKINAPTISDIGTYNPYTNSTLTIGLSGGSQSNGGNLVRMCDLYYGGTWLASAQSYDATPWWNTTQTITYAAASYSSVIGTNAYSSGNFRIVAWCENANRSRSGYVEKYFTVNINTDGGAVPTFSGFSISGGAFSYPSTCFISGVSNLGVSANTASANRAPNGTSVSYTTSVTGVPSKSGQSVNFGSLSAGRKTITVTATDSRGLSKSVSKEIQFQDYAPPSIRNYSAERLDNPQTSVKLTYTLAYSPIYAYDQGVDKPGSQLNNINSQQYSTNSTEWNNSSNGIIVTGLSTESVYTIYLRIADKLRTEIYTTEFYKVPTIKTNLAIRKHGIGINCVPQTSYALEVNGSSKISGSLDASNMLQVNSNGVAIGKASEKSAFEVNMDSYLYKNLGVTGDIYQSASSCSNSIIGSLPIAGTIDSMTLGDIRKYKSGLYTSVVDGDWSYLWVNKHRNGANDGNSYNNYIMQSFWNDDMYHGRVDGAGGIQSKHLFLDTGNFLNRLYPVGAIYLTWNNTNPGNFLGGTWVRMAEGRGLFGVGYSTDKNGFKTNVGEHEEFGYWKHKITVDEMPPHSHKLYARGGSTAQTSSPFADNKPITQGSNSYGFNVSETGGGKDFYIVPPYIGIYVWRRTA